MSSSQAGTLLDRGRTALAQFGRLPGLFALALQGFSGLIQVAAFFKLKGEPYLHFSQAFLIGNVFAIIAVLNLENSILGGRFSRSVLRYFQVLWTLGVASLIFTLVRGGEIPSFVAFGCWLVCVRMFLAWGNSATARLAPILLAGGVAAAVTLTGNSVWVMLAGFIAMPLMAGFPTRIVAPPDDGARQVAMTSLKAYLRYLPHTLSGMALGYFDRFLALSVVGGASAEAYLRTVQMCSWGAFLCFPAVFQLRSRMLRAGVVTPSSLAVSFCALTGLLLVCVFVILGVTRFKAHVEVHALPLVLVFAAILFAQFYQVISTLNFVAERFSIVNKITMFSGLVSVAVGLSLVFWAPAEVSLALMLLAGWTMQILGTMRSLLRVSAVGGVRFAR